MGRKRSILGKALRWIFLMVLLVIICFAGFLGYMTINDYRPRAVEVLVIDGHATGKFIPADTLTLVSWNIGYGGLGAEQDFFFDGGKNVRPEKELYQKYIAGIQKTVTSFHGIDFILLQEVDRGSKRSYYEDQASRLANALPDYSYAFAVNYNTAFVPQPLGEPYGKCYGGLMTLSHFQPASAARYRLAQDAAWPTGLFMLKRCYMEFRYPLNNGKELVVINQHLSAYDDGTVKQQQMDTLRKKLLEEYQKGNYVITGGDWNQFPPGYNPGLSGADGVVAMNVDSNYPEPGWVWAFDLSTPTNRKLNISYTKDKTEEVVIDYFLLSPNVELAEVMGADLGFEFSDHQPVFLRAILR